MEKNRFLLFLFLVFGFGGRMFAQVMVCNDQVFVALGENCTTTLIPEQVLEAPCNCPNGTILEVDKVPPFGNGPWTAPNFDKTDAGKTYMVRVTALGTGNMCWGNVKLEDKVPPKLTCSGLTTANLAADGKVSLTIADLQVSATDACSDPAQVTLKLTNNQTSVTYDCDDLGMNLLSVTATDAIGNTASCQTNVLVRDSANYCVGAGSGCTTGCPASQVLTYEQGIQTLLPAFQASDFAPFDAYGAPTFDGSCQPADTTYAVTYTPSANGQSWFAREWNLVLSGIPFGRCVQTLVFPTTRIFDISGKVFLDSIQNCEVDATEIGVTAFKVSITKLPSNQRVDLTPAADGTYAYPLEVNATDSLVIVRLELPDGVFTACPTVLEIPGNAPQTTHSMDFGLYSELQCPLMEVNIGNALLRRCFENNRHIVSYCNLGFQTAPAAYITVEFDTLLLVLSADLPYTNVGNLYTFSLGDVPRFTCGSFSVTTKVSCNAVLGQTLCAEATIYPHDPCGEGAWAGPKVEASAVCEGDSVRLILRNAGQQDMIEMLDFIVVEDIIMRSSGKFSLKVGEATAVKMPANGSTWRIEAEQVTGYPEKDKPSAFAETCGGLNTPGLVNAFAMNDDPIYHDIDCSEVVGSYDPNDKSATPTGYGPSHIIRENTDLEYKIRFQNTGTDTAFTVVVVDTLSSLLDWATLEAGVSSHRYRLDVLEGGILRFVFNNILLPDSNVNEAASNGFVKFRIAQKLDLPLGTVIENKAAIYFDFNDPIITNTAFHTIGAPYVVVSSTHNPQMPDVTVAVRPNPFQDQAVLEVRGHTLQDGLLRLYDTHGRAVQSQVFEGNQCKIERRGLPSGTYFFQITDGGLPVSSGRVQVH